jgi:hypothetical protein
MPGQRKNPGSAVVRAELPGDPPQRRALRPHPPRGVGAWLEQFALGTSPRTPCSDAARRPLSAAASRGNAGTPSCSAHRRITLWILWDGGLDTGYWRANLADRDTKARAPKACRRSRETVDNHLFDRRRSRWNRHGRGRRSRSVGHRAPRPEMSPCSTCPASSTNASGRLWRLRWSVRTLWPARQ